jgi:hypothetical protein
MSQSTENATSNLTEEEQILADVKNEAEQLKTQTLETDVSDEPQATDAEGMITDNTTSQKDDNVEGDANSDDQKSEDEDITKMAFKKPIGLKDRGLELPVNNMQELITLAQQGLMVTRKTEALKEHRQTIEMLKQSGVEEADIQMLADLKSGNKQALAGLAQRYNVDMFDVDADKGYTPQFKPQYATEADIVAQEIMADPVLAQSFKSVIEYVPESFKSVMASDAATLKAFSVDVQNGIAQRLLPETNKLLAAYPHLDFATAYTEAGNRIFNAQVPQVVANAPVGDARPSTARIVANADSNLKAKAGVTSSSSSNQFKSDGLDIWENGLSDHELMSRIQQQADMMRNGRQQNKF